MNIHLNPVLGEQKKAIKYSARFEGETIETTIENQGFNVSTTIGNSIISYIQNGNKTGVSVSSKYNSFISGLLISDFDSDNMIVHEITMKGVSTKTADKKCIYENIKKYFNIKDNEFEKRIVLLKKFTDSQEFKSISK